VLYHRPLRFFRCQARGTSTSRMRTVSGCPLALERLAEAVEDLAREELEPAPEKPRRTRKGKTP
jgi:hypothetical protein